MKITRNEEMIVDTELVVSFSVDYMEKELRILYADDEETLIKLTADCYNWETDDPKPQEGRIAIHSCQCCRDELLIDLIGNYWNVVKTNLDEPEEEPKALAA